MFKSYVIPICFRTNNVYCFVVDTNIGTKSNTMQIFFENSL